MNNDLGPDDLEEAGKALFGDRWQSDLGRALGISDSRRVRAFMARERPIPLGIWKDISELLRHRGDAALKLAEKLDSKQ